MSHSIYECGCTLEPAGGEACPTHGVQTVKALRDERDLLLQEVHVLTGQRDDRELEAKRLRETWECSPEREELEEEITTLEGQLAYLRRTVEGGRAYLRECQFSGTHESCEAAEVPRPEWCGFCAMGTALASGAGEREAEVIRGIREVRRLGKALEDLGHPDDTEEYDRVLSEYEEAMKQVEAAVDALDRVD